MSWLVLGLVIFLGVHSLRIVGDTWRTHLMARLGANAWKGLYALVSLIGFVLIVWGFGQARQHALPLYVPALALRHANTLFTLVAFVLIAAAYVPGNRLKAKLGHPMFAGVAVWAFGHLLATGMLHDVVLFGAFLLWAIAGFVVSRRRDRGAGVVYPGGGLPGDVLTLAIGIGVWAAFAFFLHARWIGVAPFG